MSSLAQVYQKNDRLLDRTRDIQDKTLKSLECAKRNLVQAEEKGHATLYKLNEHGDKIVKINLIALIFWYLSKSCFLRVELSESLMKLKQKWRILQSY
jgi:hypothetical protein